MVPLITVYIPTKDRVDLLQRAVDAVLRQSYPNLELIVVSDGSGEVTNNYLRRIAAQDPRVRCIFNETSIGASASRNKAIFAANGELVSGLDDDDFIGTNYLQALFDCWLAKSDNAIAIFPQAKIVVSDSRTLSMHRPRMVRAFDLIEHNKIGNQILAATRSLREVGGFAEEMPAPPDLELWYRLLKSNGAVASRCDNASYIIDRSHPHERISNKNPARIEQAYQLFVQKHRLDTTDADVLSLQLCAYSKNSPSMVKILKRLRRNPGLRNLYQCLRMLVKA